MKRIVLAASLALVLTCHAMPWDKEKKGFVQAACEKNEKVAYTCCVYDQMEDSTKITQWVANTRLAQAKKACMGGGSNPCDCLGTGVHNSMTYSYEGSDMCVATSPVFVKKGEVSTTETMASLCKAETTSDAVTFHKG